MKSGFEKRRRIFVTMVDDSGGRNFSHQRNESGGSVDSEAETGDDGWKVG